MSVIDKVDLHIRFDFTDSCNCCGIIKPSNSDIIYMNRHGEAEKFSKKKVTEDEFTVHRRSYERLTNEIKERLQKYTDHIDPYFKRIESDSLLAFSSQRLATNPLTIGQIKRINDCLEKVVEDIVALKTLE